MSATTQELGIHAVVLAAGASSRMGRPKALLDFDGQPCVSLVASACQQAGVGVVLVTGPAGEAVRAACPGEVRQALNHHPERGMLSSLQAGLAALPPDAAAFLIFPVDYPLAPAAEVRRLMTAFRARRPGQRIFVPSFAHRRGHPVLVEAALAPAFLALGEGASARDVIGAHPDQLVHVEAADDRVLLDMDTPDDYRRCLARFRAG
jgi:molybdenum cofactor cytidylyltransferase